MMTDEAWEAELVRTGRTERDKNRPRPTAPAKWTRAEISSMTGMLDTFWLLHRNPDGSDAANAAVRVREHLAIERNRTHAVLAGIRGARATSAKRYGENCEAIGNALVRKIYGDSTAEFVERFTKLAKEEDASERAAEAMLHKVLDHGLPPEVLAYDPTKGAR